MSSPDPTWWRSETLDQRRWGNIVKQALDGIRTARERGRLPQALLLIGPAGLGRELAAVEAAALMTCPEEQGPWCECASCRRARAGSHPDVAAALPTGASQVIKIDQIRQIVDSAPARPYEASRRVWIIDGVESGSLGSAAANAFLKTLEEPPEHVRFLLLGENPDAILPTIRSRCQQLMLPGLMAVAAARSEPCEAPELARAALGGEGALPDLEPVAEALRQASRGEVLVLIQLANRLADEPQAFELVAAAALGLAARNERQAEAEGGVAHSRGDGDELPGQDLVRLGSAMLAASARARAFNLNRGRQLLACLMTWFTEACRR